MWDRGVVDPEHIFHRKIEFRINLRMMTTAAEAGDLRHAKRIVAVDAIEDASLGDVRSGLLDNSDLSRRQVAPLPARSPPWRQSLRKDGCHGVPNLDSVFGSSPPHLHRQPGHQHRDRRGSRIPMRTRSTKRILFVLTTSATTTARRRSKCA